MSIFLENYESTTSSTSKYDIYCKSLEEINRPCTSRDLKYIQLILEQISKEEINEIPHNLIDKLLQLSKFCINSYEKHISKHRKNSLKTCLKLFSVLLKKVACMKYVLYSCYLCDKVFRTKNYLNSHIKRRHSNNLAKSLQSSLNSHLELIEIQTPRSAINLSEEIELLQQQQSLIKLQLKVKLQELNEQSTYIPYDNQSDRKLTSYKSLCEDEVQVFLREISSKPDSPHLEETRKPQDLLYAAQALDIDPTLDSHYLYIANEFLHKPLPKKWMIHSEGFQHKVSGIITNEHPGIKHYKKIINRMKHKKQAMVEKIKDALTPSQVVMKSKYKQGVKTYFASGDVEIFKKKKEMNSKLEDQLKKLGKITMKKLMDIERESSKRLLECPEFNYCAGVIESEIRRLMKGLHKEFRFQGFR